MGDLGRKLKEARESRGLSLKEVEEATKIRKKYLQALEEEDFKIIPGRTYARGFVKNYSNFLHLETNELLEEFDELAVSSYKDKEITPVHSMSAGENKGRSKFGGVDRESRLFKIGLAIVAVLVLFIGINMFNSDSPETAPPQNGQIDNNHANEPGTGDNNASQETPAPEPEPIEGVELKVEIEKDECWISVTSDGNTVFSGIMVEGDSRVFEGDTEIVITLGNAGAAKLTYNGEELPPPGADGEVVTLPPFVAEEAGSTGESTDTLGDTSSTYLPGSINISTQLGVINVSVS